MSILQKIALILDICAAAIYIILSALPIIPYLGFQFVIPSSVFLGILVILVGSLLFTIGLKIWQWRSVERIDGLRAFLFFPSHTANENKTLDYHTSHYHKKVIVNFRKNTPIAYPLPAAKSAFFWQLIKKCPDLWTSVEDKNYGEEDLGKWAKEKGYIFHPWIPTKNELKHDSGDIGPQIMEKLTTYKKEGKLDDFRIVFLFPWYKYFNSKDLPSKAILQKHSRNMEAYDPPQIWYQLIKYGLLAFTIKVKWPWQTIKSWCKNNGYTYFDWPYSERQLARIGIEDVSKS